VPGIPTLFQALDLTIDELDKQHLNRFSDVIKNNRGYAYLGVAGPAIGDFMPPDPKIYRRIWGNIFQLLTDLPGRKGFLSTLSGLRDALANLAMIVSDEDAEALKDLKDSGEADQIKALADNLPALIEELTRKAKLIAGWIAKDLKPKVDTNDPADPIPPETEWPVRDLLHWRKTGVFVRNLLDKAAATHDERLQAYAYGYVVGYSCMVCGSPFINSIVGGPYRTQWWRQRYVRVFVDAWVYGFYHTSPRPTMLANDMPSVQYDSWPSLCDAQLHKKLNLGPADPMDPVALLNIVGSQQPIPTLVPNDFAQRWFEVLQGTYGASVPAAMTAANFNDAYVFTWLMLWFQTSGAVLGALGCRPHEPQPPSNCGMSKSELDPFIEVGGKFTGPPPANIDDQVDETELGCGLFWSTVGSIFGFTPGGVFMSVIGDELERDSVDWEKVACIVYWNREYLYNAMAGLQRLLWVTGFGHPDPKIFTEDAMALGLSGSSKPLDSPRRMAKSRLRNPYPSKPWITVKSNVDPETNSSVQLEISNKFENDPTAADPGFETPGTTAYHTDVFPSYFLDDPSNPLTTMGDVKTGAGSGAVFRPLGGEDTPARFGNAVVNAIDLFKHIDQQFPNWNLDADRGLAWLTWKFRSGYDPNKVEADPAS